MRVVDSWNQLPSSVVEALTVSAFERRLDQQWKHQPIYYSYRDNNKVSKGAKIRSRYNQVPHLTQDTNGKVTNS